ncbi:hypothetical protein TPHA_0N01170 [Tetrapisispora phaffii CBS 4417]|uniref:K Homology domain-containing protein n=1 Tax=Tetrapisispora phaffii (strain ATCC 24235 / CBS 4417 / NBRC 1672 / NRRL Y-8282 / UCD 70-5) TaxID=1071381 RepID=G8C170_TETPH|nr:hypothetical protein TPHA_0N01170 [Tetrapisispora phaffii CBS 4417]CCE65898.1 hypothetical protein TPHA_0N01170 [Tetrapisispora phaffii CBS 4417]
MTGTEEFVDDKRGSEATDMDGNSSKVLKRKNEDNQEGQLEAEIKRVALDDDDDDDDDDAGEEQERRLDSDSKNIVSEDSNATTVDDNHIHLRLLCLVREASLVVGHRGDRISKIKNITSTKINISENNKDTPERVIHVRGDYMNVAKAIALIVKSITNTFDDQINSVPQHKDTTVVDRDTQRNFNDNNNSDELPTTLYFLISHFLMGYIIGKNGKKLKEIEESSSIKLFASPQQLLPSNDRILAITGTSDALEVAVLNISKTIITNSNNIKNKRYTNRAIFYQPTPMYSVLINNYSNISYPIHLNMDIGKNIGMQMGMNMNMGMDMNAGYSHQQHHQYHPTDKYTSYRNNKRTLPLRPVNIPQCNPSARNDDTKSIVYTPANAAKAMSFIPNFTIPNVKVVEPQIFNSDQILPMTLVTQEVYIDENFVGNIIGKDGRHINSIKESTGCSIKIDPQEEGSLERKLIIRGTSMASQAAIMLISNKIETDKMNRKER